MTEALARIRGDSVLSGPGPDRSSMKALALALAKRAKAIPARAYFAAILTAIVVGIGVNALVLQRERHPAPLFAPAPQPAPSAVSVSGPPPAAHVAGAGAPPAASAPVVPPPRPADFVNDARPLGARDPTTTTGRVEAQTEAARLTLAAQTALVKLGYAVEPDGNEGVLTQLALRDFERAHGLPLTSEITPRLVKQLQLAGRTGGR